MSVLCGRCCMDNLNPSLCTRPSRYSYRAKIYRSFPSVIPMVKFDLDQGATSRHEISKIYVARCLFSDFSCSFADYIHGHLRVLVRVRACCNRTSQIPGTDRAQTILVGASVSSCYLDRAEKLAQSIAAGAARALAQALVQ